MAQRNMMAKGKTNTGLTYELLVQGIFQAINVQEEVANLIVERDKTLQGKTTPHQIDVYWKFEKAGITYETIVQAKDWQSRVKKGTAARNLCHPPRLPEVSENFRKRLSRTRAEHSACLHVFAKTRVRLSTSVIRE